MKTLRVRYTPEAARLIRKLHPDVKRLVRQATYHLIEHPLSGHELHFELSGLWSYRVKRHRLLYRHNEQDGFIEVLFVGHRRDVYESLRDLLIEKKSGD